MGKLDLAAIYILALFIHMFAAWVYAQAMSMDEERRWRQVVKREDLATLSKGTVRLDPQDNRVLWIDGRQVVCLYPTTRKGGN